MSASKTSDSDNLLENVPPPILGSRYTLEIQIQYSIAVSLKRIADVLEQQNKPPEPPRDHNPLRGV